MTANSKTKASDGDSTQPKTKASDVDSTQALVPIQPRTTASASDVVSTQALDHPNAIVVTDTGTNSAIISIAEQAHQSRLLAIGQMIFNTAAQATAAINQASRGKKRKDLEDNDSN